MVDSNKGGDLRCQLVIQSNWLDFVFNLMIIWSRLKPDIVIVDEINKKLHIYELTVPLTMHIDQRNR